MTICMAGMTSKDTKKDKEEEEKAYKEAFDYFDWNKSGSIPSSVSDDTYVWGDWPDGVLAGSPVCHEEGRAEPHRH